MKNFMAIMKGLNDPGKLNAAKYILSKFREKNAVDAKMYAKPDVIQGVKNDIFDHMQVQDKYLEALVEIECAGPYSIFSYVLNEDFSDVIIHRTGIIMTNLGVKQEQVIPEELLPVYHIFMSHFVENIMFLTEQKFDASYNIVDAELGIFRFNLIHRSLTISHHDMIVIRKQTINKGFNMDGEKYLASIQASNAQRECINKYAKEGNCIVFGATGSGKTTLVKYMGNHELNGKRNLCTIEDTAELFIDCPIALVTNTHADIKKLFTASLRQNPSHVIIGETRTDEIVDILEASLTVSVITTIHANSFERAIERIIFMSMERSITSQDMRDLINASVDCFIYMKDRKIAGIWEHKHGGHHMDVYDAYEEVK